MDLSVHGNILEKLIHADVARSAMHGLYWMYMVILNILAVCHVHRREATASTWCLYADHARGE